MPRGLIADRLEEVESTRRQQIAEEERWRRSTKIRVVSAKFVPDIIDLTGLKADDWPQRNAHGLPPQDPRFTSTFEVDLDPGFEGRRAEISVLHVELTNLSSGKKLNCHHPWFREQTNPFKCDIFLYPLASAGIWNVTQIGVHDTLGRHTHLTSAEINLLPFRVPVLNVINPHQDEEAPMLEGLDLVVTEPDPRNPESHLWVNFTLRVSDAGGGFEHAMVAVIDSKGEARGGAVVGSHERVSGDETNGAFAGSLRLHRLTEGGRWYIRSIELFDKSFNKRTVPAMLLYTRKMPTSFVLPTRGDRHPPRLVNVTAQATTLYPGASASFTVSAEDDAAGIVHVVLRLKSPAGEMYTDGAVPTRPIVTGRRDLVVRVYLPLYAEPGDYVIEEIMVFDDVNNKLSVKNKDLERMGLLSKITIKPPEPPVFAPSGDSVTPQKDDL